MTNALRYTEKHVCYFDKQYEVPFAKYSIVLNVSNTFGSLDLFDYCVTHNGIVLFA